MTKRNMVWLALIAMVAVLGCSGGEADFDPAPQSTNDRFDSIIQSGSDGLVSASGPTASGGMAVCGSVRSGGRQVGWLVFIEADGSVTRQVLLPKGHIARLTCVAEVAGGYVAGGYVIESGQPHAHVWLLRIDALGNVAWDRVFADDQWQQPLAITAAVAGGFWVSLVNVDQSEDGIRWEYTTGSLVEYDMAGEQVARYDNLGWGHYPATMIRTAPDGDLLLARCWFATLFRPGEGVVWEWYDPDQYLIVNCAVPEADGYLIGGQRFVDASGNMTQDACLVRLDPAREVVWKLLVENETPDTMGQSWDSIDDVVPVDTSYVVLASIHHIAGTVTYDIPTGAGGISGPSDTSVSEEVSTLDALVLGIDSAGEITWGRRHGDGGFDLGVGLRASTPCDALVSVWNSSRGGIGIGVIRDACE